MEIQIELKSEEILKIVSELDIFKFYCPSFKELDKPFNSEFRDDPTPSCRIADRGNGFFLYKDFGETTSHNCWGYVMRKFSCNYREALMIICEDFDLVDKYENAAISFIKSKTSTKAKQLKTNKYKSNNTIIKVKRRPWSVIDKKFWTDNYGIGKKTLEAYNVSPITNFWINEYSYNCNISNSYCYYYYYNGIHRFKIYQPYSQTNKWFSNIDTTVVQGIKMIPKSGDILIITKSLKDVMCLYEMGYNAIAPNNETGFIPEINIDKFKNRFKDIIVYFDNDATGLKNGEMFANKYGLKWIYNPLNERKDISDVIHYEGIDYAKNLLKQLI